VRKTRHKGNVSERRPEAGSAYIASGGGEAGVCEACAFGKHKAHTCGRGLGGSLYHGDKPRPAAVAAPKKETAVAFVPGGHSLHSIRQVAQVLGGEKIEVDPEEDDGAPPPLFPRKERPEGAKCLCMGELQERHCNRGMCGSAAWRAGIQYRLKIMNVANGRGLGVIAEEPIPSGQFVCEYIGHALSNEEAMRREEAYEAHDQHYLLDVENVDTAQYTIDGTLCGNVARFVNHSCEASLCCYDVYDGPNKAPRIIFVTMKDIRAGEEVTINYHPEHQSADGLLKRVPCQCGSKKCVGWLF